MTKHINVTKDIVDKLTFTWILKKITIKMNEKLKTTKIFITPFRTHEKRMTA